MAPDALRFAVTSRQPAEEALVRGKAHLPPKGSAPAEARPHLDVGRQVLVIFSKREPRRRALLVSLHGLHGRTW